MGGCVEDGGEVVQGGKGGGIEAGERGCRRGMLECLNEIVGGGSGRIDGGRLWEWGVVREPFERVGDARCACFDDVYLVAAVMVKRVW